MSSEQIHHFKKPNGKDDEIASTFTELKAMRREISEALGGIRLLLAEIAAELRKQSP